jgi:membrane protein DedA with SNARE-associated domain
MDVVVHDASSPNGSKIKSMSWSNPLTVSLISGRLKISSSAGTFDYGFTSFPLAYITAGSTDKTYVCSGGEVDIWARTEPASNNLTEIALIIVIVVVVLAILAVVVYEKKRIRRNTRDS